MLKRLNQLSKQYTDLDDAPDTLSNACLKVELSFKILIYSSALEFIKSYRTVYNKTWGRFRG